MENQGWEKTKLNTVNRYRNRGMRLSDCWLGFQLTETANGGKYDYQTVNTIVDETPILHVSFDSTAEAGQPAFPVILPMLGCSSNYPGPDTEDRNQSRVIYLHGYVTSRILRLAQVAKDRGDQESGIPVCVCATQLDGIVLALTPNHHSCNYRSAVVFGHAHVVTDESERLYAMKAITNNLVPERWENTRYPNATELKSTGILRVEIASASAKVRSGTTGEDRNDLKDEAMRQRVWAGVIPAYLQLGKPIPAPTNLTKGTPAYIKDWVEESNPKAEEYAYDVAS